MSDCYKQIKYSEERSLFGIKNAEIEDCTFTSGESPLKETADLTVRNCSFEWKYPFWYASRIQVKGSKFATMARAGIWYTTDVDMADCIFDAPKCFRRCLRVHLSGIDFRDAAETLWNCEDVTLNQIKAAGSHFAMNSKTIRITDTEIKGDYAFMECSDLELERVTINGNYSFDGCRNVTIRDSVLNSKDCVWNCSNVTLENCEIKGEYLAWNSDHVTLINCRIKSLQGLCYVKDLKLVNCRLKGTSLAFEYSEVDAGITDGIDSVMNPIGGRIVAPSIGKLIMDPNEVDPAKTEIQADVFETLDHFDGEIPAE